MRGVEAELPNTYLSRREQIENYMNECLWLNDRSFEMWAHELESLDDGGSNL